MSIEWMKVKLYSKNVILYNDNEWTASVSNNMLNQQNKLQKDM